MHSEITTWQKVGDTKIGTLAGGLGAGMPVDLAAARKLASLRPVRATAELRWRLSRQDEKLRVRTEGRFPKDGASYTILIVETTGPLTEELTETLSAFLCPVPADVIEKWLAELSVLSPKRAQDDFTMELMMTAYTSRLRQYPADIVRYALLDHAWRFFPSWAELREVCDRLAQPRNALLAAYQSAEARHAKMAREG